MEAGSNSSRAWPAEGVKVEHRGYADTYTGDRAAIAALPVCPSGMFDGEGETWKSSRTVHSPDGRRVSLAVRRPGRYSLTIGPSREEAKANEARRARQAEIRAHTVRARAAREELQRMPASAEAWRGELLALFDTVFAKHLQVAVDGRFGALRGGYRLGRPAQEEVGRHLRAIRSVLCSSDPVLDADLRRTQVEAILAPLRGRDATIDALLRGAGKAADDA